MSDDHYPEHLNPFAESKAKSKLKLSSSFRSLTKTLRRSFRIKNRSEKEDDVEIRRKTGTLRHVPVSYPNCNATLSPPLPRSRFLERVSHRIDPEHKEYEQHRNSADGSNPFEESKEAEAPTPRRRRSKKQAPLPPGSLSSQNMNDSGHLDVPSSSSQWSLSSEITVTSSNYSVERDYHEEASENQEANITKEFSDFNKQMDQLNESYVETSVDKRLSQNSDSDQMRIKPDLVISCPNSDNEATARVESDSVNIDIKELDDKALPSEEVVEAEHKIERQIENDVVDSCDEEILIVHDITANLRNPDISDIQTEVVEANDDTLPADLDGSSEMEKKYEVDNGALLQNENGVLDQHEIPESSISEKNVEATEEIVENTEVHRNHVEIEVSHLSQVQFEIEVEPVETSVDKTLSVIVEDVEEISNEKQSDIVPESYEGESLEELKNDINAFLFHERIPIGVVANSTNDLRNSSDRLTQSGLVTCTTDSKEDLGDSKNNKNGDDDLVVTDSTETPFPKVRRHKITKSMMLGTSST